MDDPLLLSRIQFALNISFHILFPTITLGLAWMLVFFKCRFKRTGDDKWMKAYFYWVKIFALTFAIGVVSGITMPFQFATNWPGYLETVGNIAGPILAYEVLIAFFMEGTFIGVMLFGYKRIPNWFHTLSTTLVALGATLSAFIILTLVSWMVTPAGFEMREGIAHATSWFDIIFNPSNLHRFVHMMLAAAMTTSFLLAGVAAYRWLKSDRSPEVLAVLRTGVYSALVFSLIQIGAGDLHGVNTSIHQPQTMAAAEAIWKTEKGAPFIIFAIPDDATQSNSYEIALPRMASILMTHQYDGEVKGIDAFPDHPSVAPVFYSFRVMVYLGFLMALVALCATWVVKKRRGLTPFWAKTLVVFTFSGWVATLAGWYVTEMGRQPFLVQGVLRTADAATTAGTGMLTGTFLLYLGSYIILLPAYIVTIFYLARRAARQQQQGNADKPGAPQQPEQPEAPSPAPEA